MARYEYQEGSSSKFWEISLDTTSFTTKHGKIGSAGQTLLKEWPDAATAKREHDKLVAQKLKKGYVLVGDSSPKKAIAPKTAKAPAKPVAAATTSGAYNPTLAKQIDANPEDGGAWSVYADWLQSQGDPRGELAVVQDQLRGRPKDATLLKAEKKLLQQHAATLLGDWTKYLTRSGKSEIPGVTAKQPLEPEYREYGDELAPVRIRWRSGFIEQLTIGHPGYDWSPGGNADDDEDGDGDGGADDDDGFDVPAMLEKILASPAARFMTSLRLGMPQSGEDGEASYDRVIKTLAKQTDVLGRLRTLYIGDFAQEECEVSWVFIGDVSKLYPHLKNLRSLTLRAGGFALGKPDLPSLRELILITGGLDKKNIAAIAAAKWPRLEKLELWLGTKRYGGNVGVKDVATLLASKNLPKLKHLGLRNSEIADDLAGVIVTSPLVKQLDTLDVSKGTMTDAGAQALIADSAALSHLARIDVSDNFLEKSAAAAAKIGKAVRTNPQRKASVYGDGEVYRYVALGE